MRKRFNRLSWLGVCSVVVACAVCAGAQNGKKDAELELLAGWMAGEFDTFAQVAADETARTAYKHVRVVLRIVP